MEPGGPRWVVVDVTAGDAVLIPAGVSHCNVGQSDDLLVIGADGAAVDLKRDTDLDRGAALAAVAAAMRPERDPVLGGTGRLLSLRA